MEKQVRTIPRRADAEGVGRPENDWGKREDYVSLPQRRLRTASLNMTSMVQGFMTFCT
jgi:hypothetical protein